MIGGKGQCEVGKGILCALKGMGFAPFVTGIDMILCPMFELWSALYCNLFLPRLVLVLRDLKPIPNTQINPPMQFIPG